jgi:hypothetical protein
LLLALAWRHRRDRYRAIGLAVPAMRVMVEAELAEIVKQLATVRFTSPGAGDALQSGGKQRGAVLMECVVPSMLVIIQIFLFATRKKLLFVFLFVVR